ncbi:MAG: transcriptional regulator [Nocardioidaceae bacterium]
MLADDAAAMWPEVTGHPFVLAAGDGSLDPAAFDRWIAADYVYVIGCRRLVAGLIALAPDEGQREVLTASLPAVQAELDLFRGHATRRGIDLDAEPGPTTVGYTAYTQAVLYDGYPVALTAFYGIEKAYYDAWSAVRAQAADSSPYWPFIDNWSSPRFGRWVADLAGLVDRSLPNGPTPDALRAFRRVARFEARFWDAVYHAETW